METKELCPICGEGYVTSHVQQIEHEYKGHKAMLASHYQECDTCLSEFAGAREGKLSKRGVIAFRKSVDGLLTGAEITALRDKYKLTQAQAAKLFGGGPVAFSKYENDDVAQSDGMDALLRLVRDHEDSFWNLAKQKGMVQELLPNKPKLGMRLFMDVHQQATVTSAVDDEQDVSPSAMQPYGAAKVSTITTKPLWKH